ncbi:hypothetical protein [Paracoccus aestuariivivens]|uniref:Uncharacterized protein n=1 Tax=Paracoccus aestuariivivens TaxID=1820333 RepID=A0A6L6JEC3_9RHOB|nr:hypothetical protein [Paracoccus aestuariivivens]MTH79866.1 hypothetical protein [Paracoccus aestuariivivens]
MALKEKFSTDDWTAVLQAPMLVGLAVTAADPGGLIGAVQESAAVASSVQQAEAGTIGAEIAEAYKTSEGRHAATDGVKPLVKGKKPAEISDAAIARVGEIVGMFDRTAPESASEFRTFLMDIATRVAEAAKEGGFLGFGGEPVSEPESKALDALRAKFQPQA